MRPPAPLSLLALPFVLSLACSGKEAGDTSGVTPREFSDCDPLSYDYCALPFPSTYYMREDDTSPTGWRVHLGATTLPITHQGYQPDPALWNERDGYAPLGPVLAYFPDLKLDAGVVGHDDIGASLDDGASIVVLDAETGERQPYFAELDVSGTVVMGQEFLIVRPVRPLQNGHRYIVAYRNLKDSTGALISASEGFAALRDGTPTDNWDIEGRRDSYEAIFSTLEADGWQRGEVQLAFDWVVGSDEGITGKARFMIEDMLNTVGAAGPAFTVDSVQDEYNENIYRKVAGTMTVPLYMEADEPGTLLTRGPDGMPFQNGTTTVPYTILVPRTAAETPRALPLVQYGHGLLGDQGEVEAGYLAEMANRDGFVLFAVDWTGMKSQDTAAVQLMLVENIDRFAILPERSEQGFVEFAGAAAMMQGAMSTDDAVMFPDPSGGPPVSAIDPNTIYYYGNSQGGILGGAYLALSPVIERGVLGVPGTPYSLLLPRSADFTPFFMLFQAVYADQRDITLWMVLMDTLWDSGEAHGYASDMVDNPLWGTPKQVLLQDALGDAQVTNLGAQIMARAYHAKQPNPVLREVWGVEDAESGFTGNGLGEYSYGAPPEPYENLPPDADYDTHEDTRRNAAAQSQLWTFLTTGTVVNDCDGNCDPGTPE